MGCEWPIQLLAPCSFAQTTARADCLEVSSRQSGVPLSHWQSALWSLRRVRSVEFTIQRLYLPACIRFLDLLFQPPASSSTRPSSSARLNHLTIIIIALTSESEGERLYTALSRALLRCPPLCSAALRTAEEPTHVPTTAALRHLAGSGRLLHLGLGAEEVSQMLWVTSRSRGGHGAAPRRCGR